MAEDKMFIMSPAAALLYNMKTKRWHPIFYREAPLPGPSTPDKPIRLRSIGHHAPGFDDREAAIESIKETAAKITPETVIDVEKDIEWDGEDVPADTVFLSDKKIVRL